MLWSGLICEKITKLGHQKNEKVKISLNGFINMIISWWKKCQETINTSTWQWQFHVNCDSQLMKNNNFPGNRWMCVSVLHGGLILIFGLYHLLIPWGKSYFISWMYDIVLKRTCAIVMISLKLTTMFIVARTTEGCPLSSYVLYLLCRSW